MSEVKAQNSISMTSVKAIKDASDEATTLLDGMRQSALDAGTTLNGIYQVAKDAEQSASDAQASADSASEYASRAYANLSSVQSITETLNWITAHGTMTLTSDTALDPSHVYFVVDANGDYVVGGTHYSVVSEPVLADIGTYYELSINESLNNYVATHLVVDTEGLWIIPDSGGNKVLIATGSGSTYTDAGTYIINGNTVLASFTANGAQIGQTGESHLEMDYHSMQLVDKEDNAYFYVSDLRDKDDDYQATVTETFTGDGNTTEFKVNFDVSVGVSATDSSDPSNTATRSNRIYTFASAPTIGATVTIVYKTRSVYAKAYTLGTRNTASIIGALSIAEGFRTIASGFVAHAEGEQTEATGRYSHAEGYKAKAIGECSHAEGSFSVAIGECSHAEGELASADGWGSHAEGKSTWANGEASHAEGYEAYAMGYASHAQNANTVAHSRSQTVLGEYNREDTTGTETTRGTYAVIVGNGTSDTARSNALTIDWSGNVVASGSVDGTDITASGDITSENAYLQLDTTATSGTDKEIYDALVSLGWDSDVIV